MQTLDNAKSDERKKKTLPFVPPPGKYILNTQRKEYVPARLYRLYLAVLYLYYGALFVLVENKQQAKKEGFLFGYAPLGALWTTVQISISGTFLESSELS